VSSEQAKAGGCGGQHAVVIGASMAGLLSGRVLSDHFERVTIIERDRLPESAEARKGIPQGRHVHGLLSRGAAILKEYFPDLFPALVKGGSSYVDTLADVCWYYFDVWKLQFPSDMTGYSQSRPFLEQHVREHLAARSNVFFIDECEVARLCSNEDDTRVTGVQLRYRGAGHHEAELTADLVVDASGRGSQAPQWLASMGYGEVRETIVKVDVGYATRIYRRTSQTPFDGKVLIIYPTPPNKRAGYVFPIEGDRWMVTLAGWLRDYPSNDEPGFLDYARSLSVPDLYEVIKDAVPVTPIATHKFPSSQRRHYERMSRFPEGFVVLGDAACSFNPIYGQGMTTAALEAKSLDTCLYQQSRLRGRGDLTGLARRFQKAIAKTVEVPWWLATGEDFRHPETVGYRPPGMGLLNWYTARVHVLAGSHPAVTLRLYQVLNMLKPPTVLFEPRVLFPVLFKWRGLQGEREAKMKIHRAQQRKQPAEAEQLRS
jgi:2-polyprenyl-6-methoxyphenol hydroxylase-like FAD-dependent oxidoreductase